MNDLSDGLLRETYTKAVDLDLSHEFILMLEEELSKRTMEHNCIAITINDSATIPHRTQ